MSNEFLEATTTLRDKAWGALMASQAYAYFKAMDDATVAAGGTSLLANSTAHVAPVKRAPPIFSPISGDIPMPPKRMSQPDTAEAVLREAGEPLPIGRLLEGVVAKGIEFKGDNPLPSFRSAMSKDKRFTSVMRNGLYFWWFEGEPLPLGWNDEAGPDLLDEPASSSVHSNQEGGEGHAATMS